ncbi:MAG: HAD family hydrolase [Actinomycetota bacterium]
MSIDAVIFDWGGTLTPWRTIDVAATWRAYAAAAASVDAEAIAAALHAAEVEAWAGVRDHQVSSTFFDILAAAGVDHHEEAVAAYLAAWEPHTFTDPDVATVFAGLRERGIRVGVLSNTLWPRSWHEGFFERDGVLELVDGGVYTSELPYTKPHERAFRAAMAEVRVDDPERCVFVGDRPFDDISGAQAIGMRTILVPHSDIPAEQQVPVDVRPDAVVDRLGEVIHHVDTWIDGRVDSGRDGRRPR